MLKYLLLVIKTLFSALQGQRQLALENLALRQQLALLHQTVKRPRITPLDRYFWVIFSKQIAGGDPCSTLSSPIPSYGGIGKTLNSFGHRKAGGERWVAPVLITKSEH